MTNTGTGMLVPDDPISHGNLAQFARDLRAGRTTSLQVTQAYLARIERLDSTLNAYQHVNAECAIATAKAMDALLDAGTDFGPLMGVPVALKDVFRLCGYPAPTAGSLVDMSAIVGADEGPFIQALRRCGVVILGTTKAVELCLGITGVSAPLGTPWNPWDLGQQRVPGGSSSGSAVACAAGLCAFAVGTDSGGSVRTPAAFNGVFGFKTTFGRWPMQGAVPLDPKVDTIGLLTKTAKDCQLAADTIDRQLFGYSYAVTRKKVALHGLRLGRPMKYFYEDLSPEVESATRMAQETLEAAGCIFQDLEVTEAAERTGYFPVSMPASLLAVLGRQGFESARPRMDPIVSERIASGLGIAAHEYLAVCQKRDRSIQAAQRYFEEVDVLACPTTVSTAPLLSDFDDPRRALRNAMHMSRNTQPVNYLEQCAVSIPLPQPAGMQPVGFQLIGASGQDVRLMDIALAIEGVLGSSRSPDFSALG